MFKKIIFIFALLFATICTTQAADVIPSTAVKFNGSSVVLTTANLGSGAVYTSSWYDTLGGQKFVGVSAFANQAGSFVIQYTDDQAQTPLSTATNTVLASTSYNSGIISIPTRYFRVVYTNGGVAQTSFELILTTAQIASTGTFSGGIGTRGNPAISGIDLVCGTAALNCKLQSTLGFEHNATACSGNLINFKNNGTSEFSVDCSGNSVSTGTTTATTGIFSGSVKGGSATAATCTPGDGCFSRTLSTGGLNIGGSTDSCQFDYGTTVASTFVVPCATRYTNNSGFPIFITNGGLKAAGSIESGSSTSASLGSGDLGASRSATTGNLFLGGSTTSGTLNFGLTTAGKFTFSTDTNINGNVSTSASGQNFYINNNTAGWGVFGQSSINAPYIGCSGTSQNCPISFRTAGNGSSATASIDNLGTYTVGGSSFQSTQAVIAGQGNAFGASLKLQDTTNTALGITNKYIRSNGINGYLEFLNNAHTAVIMSLDDYGTLNAPGMTMAGANLGGTNFNFINGITIQGNANLATNSDSLSGWTLTNLTLGSGGPSGATDAEATGTGSNIGSNLAISNTFGITPGITYTPSYWLDGSQVLRGLETFQVLDILGNNVVSDVNTSVAKLSATRLTGPTFNILKNYANNSDSLTGWTFQNATAGTDGPGGANDAYQLGTGGAGGTLVFQYPVTIVPGYAYSASFWLDQTYFTSGATNGVIGIGDVTGFGAFGSNASVPWGSGPGRYGKSNVNIPTNVTPEGYDLWTLTGSATSSPTAGPGSVQRLRFTTGTGTAQSPLIPVTAGGTISMSALYAANTFTSGAATVTGYDQTGAAIPGLTISYGTSGYSRRSVSSITIPGGVTGISIKVDANGAGFTGTLTIEAIQVTLGQADPGGYVSSKDPAANLFYEAVSPVITSGQKLKISQPMMVIASSFGSYYISSQTPQIVLNALTSSGQLNGFAITNAQKFKISQPMLRTDGQTTPYVSSSTGNNLALNAPANGANDVVVNYNNSSTGTFKVYDGGTTNKSTYGAAFANVSGPVTATQFNGSGAGLTATSVPDTALSHAPLPPIAQAQTAFNSTLLTTGGLATTLATTTLTLGTSNGPSGNWRVYVRTYATTQDASAGTAVGRVNFGIGTASQGTSEFRMYSHPATNTKNSNFVSTVVSDVSTLLGQFNGDALQNSTNSPVYIATYANGSNLSFTLYAQLSTAIASDTVNASGWLEIEAIPQ